MNEVPVPINLSSPEFADDEAKLVELKQSKEIVDQLTVILMEPHAGKAFSDECDSSGLWYAFARPKAIAIVKRFNVINRDHSS